MTESALRLRTATFNDVVAMHRIRMAVRENQLSNTTGLTEESYLPFISSGDARVAEGDTGIIGFAAIDAAKANVWALFVEPGAEGRGVGRALHEHVLSWARYQGLRLLWLTTDRGTRAERFYTSLGWFETGQTATGEIRFERQLDDYSNSTMT